MSEGFEIGREDLGFVDFTDGVEGGGRSVEEVDEIGNDAVAVFRRHFGF